MEMRKVIARVANAAAMLLVLTGAGTSAPAEAQPSGRVVAIGDIHGASDRLHRILRQSRVMDRERRWTGGTATLVQTGDFTDRGAQVREVMDLLMRLEDSAPDGGGQVRVLLGNHETMNLTADVRDVTAAIFASFASTGADQRREDAYRRYVEHAARRRADLGRPLPGLLLRDEWMRAHPVGFIEYMEAMGPDGRYGRWLRDKPIATVVGDTVFLHGGLSPDLEASSVDGLNDAARKEIKRFDRHRRHLIDTGIILPFSTLEEIFAAVALEVLAWNDRLSPGPREPHRSPPSVTREESAHLDVLMDLRTIASWSIVDPDGPLWFRGFAQWSDEDGAAIIGDLLSRFGVTRAVVGHSVTASRRITGRFGQKVFLIDTGMLEGVYQGRDSALELLDGRVTAIYPGERVPLDVHPPVR